MLAKDLEALKRENRLLKAKERVPQFQDAAEEYADSQILSGPTASRRFRDQSQSNLAEGSVTASLPHFPVNRQKDEQIHRHRRSGAATNATALNYQTAIGPGLLNQRENPTFNLSQCSDLLQLHDYRYNLRLSNVPVCLCHIEPRH